MIPEEVKQLLTSREKVTQLKGLDLLKESISESQYKKLKILIMYHEDWAHNWYCVRLNEILR